ncbi:hypothetical protein Tsubulata_039486 [Turnera subulata]|uniref:CASP-like protein n=1 Tax=Turnera subulata TaxID=218843 RepID=A0A9Q0J2L3_9ROSI|nr:hypothetical protein Tsubulata_039486 [Turnera subulata]
MITTTTSRFCRYVYYAASIGTCYALLQLPFAVYFAIKGARMIPNGCWPEFDFYGDKVISYLLATATGAGLAFSCEFKSFLDKLFELITNEEADAGEAKHQYDNFLSRGNVPVVSLDLLGITHGVYKRCATSCQSIL